VNSFNINRRDFLKGATASLVLGALGAQGMEVLLPSKTWRVGLIGTGWYGKSDLFRLLQVAQVDVVALCDVDNNRLNDAAALVSRRQKSNKAPRLYGNYSSMLSENQLDIVLIGTPDHWHALQTIDALKAGANVYVQKPISVDVIEGEAMVAAARKYERAVQVGMQRRSTPHLIEAKRNIVDAGLLGKISHAEMFCYYPMKNVDNPPTKTVPSFLDFEMWTGPAPLLPYRGLPHGDWWRGFMEYGNGIIGDMGVHMLDAVRWMLDLKWPSKIYSTGGIFQPEEGLSNISDTQTALFEFDNLTCVWQHRTWGGPADPEYPWGYKLYGEKGTLSCSVMKYDFMPVGNGNKIHRDVTFERGRYPEDLQEKDIELHTAPATRRHMLNFLQAIETATRPVADIEEGHISTACCILANLSMKTGQPIRYDPQNREVIGDRKATQLLLRPYRSPWTHPDPNQV
jgi:predicted dehydrogenase